MASSSLTPEQRAREQIDAALVAAGWVVQDRDHLNLKASRGVAVREVAMARGHGTADYLLFVDGKAVGVLEAKRVDTTLSGVEGQAQRYSDGLPKKLDAPIRPLPFVYLSTGARTEFFNRLDPFPRSREVFAPHRPETLAEWLRAEPLTPGDARPSTLRGRLRHMPPPEGLRLWPHQQRAIAALEGSFARDQPRALVQMATGSGKSKMAVAAAYRLIKFAQARRILFLVDRTNLGEQMEAEFHGYRSYDDNKKFTELYGVQRLTSEHVGAATKVVICTIQRLYSLLRRQPLPDEDEQLLSSAPDDERDGPPVEVTYEASIPPEHFDFIVIDECHRSIYSRWRNVLEYFDAYLIGLTATPSQRTSAFFHHNRVMEYDHEQALADGVNVGYDVYRIRTKVTEQGATLESEPGALVGRRNRLTRVMRWEQQGDDITYGADQLDHDVVAEDQIRLCMRTLRERLFTEIFPGRTEVPKTLVFAKDDGHAEDLVKAIRLEFARGNDFCRKITYKVTGQKPKDLLQDFRTAYDPRIAVTVDMIATGTDVQPIEILVFMRAVKSRGLYEQMKGRGVRVVTPEKLELVTRDAKAKTHFVIVDCVGVTDVELRDRGPLERKPSVALEVLLEEIGYGVVDEDRVSSLASRLSRLDRRCTADERERIAKVAGGVTLRSLVHGMLRAVDADVQVDAARTRLGDATGAEPSEAEVDEATQALLRVAVEPLASNPELRALLVSIKQVVEQLWDPHTKDVLISAQGRSGDQERVRARLAAFERYLAGYVAEHAKLRLRPKYEDVEALEAAMRSLPGGWQVDVLWESYAAVDPAKVTPVVGKPETADLVALMRYALHDVDQLVPYAEQVRGKFAAWMDAQEARGRSFTTEERRWLEMMRDHVAGTVELGLEDFELTPFREAGGIGKARMVFGKELPVLVRELDEALGG
jgi:type I restriction enzyme, R subunit